MDDQPPYPPEEQPQPAEAVAGPKVYHSEIDPELKTMAVKQMVEAVKGNGLKAEDVDITEFEGETLEFLAITELALDTKMSIKRQSGKVTGPKLLPNQAAFQEELNKETHKIAHNLDVVERICEAVLERDDKGLCLKGVMIKLPFLHKDFVAHEPCSACGGKGKIQCTRCHGKGEEVCPRCHGQGTEVCPTCGGRQYIIGPGGEKQQCQRCNGQGRIACTLCHGQRAIQCTVCKGVGTILCKQCNGHGWNSVIGMAEINPIAHYDFDRNGIPMQAQEKLDILGSDIQHHSHIQIVHRHKELEEERDDISIPYHIKVPMAQVSFKLKEKLDVPAFLFGTQGKLWDEPPFLEKIMSPGIKALKHAAMGQGDVAAHLQKAGRYKTLRHLILATSKAGPKKALKAVLEKNPIGMEEENTKKMIMMAKQALGLIGKKPKQIGFLLGTLIAAAIGALYYLAARAMILPHLSQANLTIAADILCALLATGIGYVCARAYIKQAVHNALERLFARKK